jgi:adenosylcobinamide-GDP ribazoletransferase
MLRGLFTSLRTLTIVPLPGRDAASMAASLPWFPLAGLLVGLVLSAGAWGVGFVSGGDWPEAAALFILFCGTVITGALHADGLADWADSLGCRGDRARALAIMRDSSVGAFGVLALVLFGLAKWVALVRLVDEGMYLWIVAAYVVSRTMQVELATTLPYARAEGGKAASFVEGARPVHRGLAHALCLAMLVALMGPAGAAVHATSLAVCRTFRAWCVRRYGGVTGDLLGACNELVETFVMFVGAVAGSRLSGVGWGLLVNT